MIIKKYSVLFPKMCFREEGERKVVPAGCSTLRSDGVSFEFAPRSEYLR